MKALARNFPSRAQSQATTRPGFALLKGGELMSSNSLLAWRCSAPDDLSLSTNGVLLGKKARALRETGLLFVTPLPTVRPAP